MSSPGSELVTDIVDVNGVTVVEVSGLLDTATYARLRMTLMKCAVEQPRALIVDVGALAVGALSALTVFSAVATQVSQWPAIPVLLVASGPEADLLDTGHVSRFVPVYGNLAAAVAAAGDPPPRRVARRSLPNSLESARLARRFVEETCVGWSQPELSADAVMVANEFVENTLRHTYSAPSVRVELRRGLLTIAVYDDDPTPALLPEPGVTGPGRLGLTFVSKLARSWGCSPTLSGGKVVWAVLAAAPTPPRSR